MDLLSIDDSRYFFTKCRVHEAYLILLCYFSVHKRTPLDIKVKNNRAIISG